MHPIGDKVIVFFYVNMKGEPIWTVVSSLQTPGKHRAVSRDAWLPPRRRHARCVHDEGAARSGGGTPKHRAACTVRRAATSAFRRAPACARIKKKKKGGGGVCGVGVVVVGGLPFYSCVTSRIFLKVKTTVGCGSGSLCSFSEIRLM